MAGRLHVEVVRVGGGLDDSIAGGEETDNNHDAEIQDRKLVCMVWHRPLNSSKPLNLAKRGAPPIHQPPLLEFMSFSNVFNIKYNAEMITAVLNVPRS